MALSKWTLTWLLALIPVLLHIIGEHNLHPHINWSNVFGTGEVFLVCIVMVAEPLGRVAASKIIHRQPAPGENAETVASNFRSGEYNLNIRKICYIIAAALIIVASTYMYSLLTIKPPCTVAQIDPKTKKEVFVRKDIKENGLVIQYSISIGVASFLVGFFGIQAFKHAE